MKTTSDSSLKSFILEQKKQSSFNFNIFKEIKEKWHPSFLNRIVDKTTENDHSKANRIIGCMVCGLTASVCFGLAMMYAPLIILKLRKFILVYTLGFLFSVASLAFLFGPYNFITSVIQSQHLPFTLGCFISLSFTLYSAVYLQNTTLTLLGSIFQIVVFVYYLFSFIPGGKTSIKLFSAFAKKTINQTLPV